MYAIRSYYAPDLETRIAILREKAATKGYPNIDHKIHEYIATKSVSNIRKLEGALTKVITFAEFSVITSYSIHYTKLYEIYFFKVF